jgi:hypothetical protein
VAFDVAQRAGAQRATGSFRLVDRRTGLVMEANGLGVLQTAAGWASFTGRARLRPSGEARSFTAIVEEADPAVPARAMILVEIEGMPGLRGSFDRQRLSLTHGEPGTR